MDRVPPLTSFVDLPAYDAWAGDAIGKYQVEVTIRRQEHACWDDLRAKGVIR